MRNGVQVSENYKKLSISILFNCSSSKKNIGIENIIYKQKTDIQSSFNQWEKQIKESHEKNKKNLVPLKELYTGSLWNNDIKKIQTSHIDKNINYFVFSAGLGVRSFEDLGQPYNITFSNNNDTSISDNLEDKVKWLGKLENSSSFNKIYQKKSNIEKLLSSGGTTFIVLSKDYMRVFLKYLEKNNFLLNNNIFLLCSYEVSSSYYKNNTIRIKSSMDYIFDQSLSRYKKRGYAGGASVRLLNDILKEFEVFRHEDIVKFLNKKDKSNEIIKPKRKANVTDEEIKTFIRNTLIIKNISISKLHRKLRDEKLWQCEDKRFAKLYKEVKGSL